MVQEHPSEPSPSESSDEDDTGAESSDDPLAGRMEDEEREDASGGEGESSTEAAVEEAVADADEASTETDEATTEVDEGATEADGGMEEPPQTGEPETPGTSGTTDVTVETAPHEEAALQRVKTVSKLLDEAVRVPGTNFRVGIDPILGIVPGAGDTVAAALSLYPVAEAYRLDAPPLLIAKMLSLIAVDLVVGSVPLLGPLFDAFWKANEWNARSLERHLQRV